MNTITDRTEERLLVLRLEKQALTKQIAQSQPGKERRRLYVRLVRNTKTRAALGERLGVRV